MIDFMAHIQMPTIPASPAGSRVANRIVRSSLICGFGLGGLLLADDLALRDDTNLTGIVRSIDDAGMVELTSELAPQPVWVKPEAIAKIHFSGNSASQPPPTAMVELVNGDRLPANIEALDDKQLTVVSPAAGRLVIPRAAVKSLQLGIRCHTAVYSGPHDLDEWTHGQDDAKNWIFERNGLIATGQAAASKTIALPKQFILRLTLKWQPKQIPNFQLFFADPLQAKATSCDRYFLQFGDAGVEIKRESSHGRRFTTIMQLNRPPNQYPNHQLQVELLVDRKNSRLQLLLNGEPEGTFVDPVADPPDGSGITLACNAPNGNTQEIRDIEIFKLEDSPLRQRVAERGDPHTDTLLSRQDDRWNGHLIEIHQAGDQPVMRFQSSIGDDPLEIPTAEVATVLFATSADHPPDTPTHPFLLHLRWDGTVRISACQFRDDMVAATHPLLGQLPFRRDGIVSLEHSDSTPAPLSKP